MDTEHWQLTILDAHLPVDDLGALAVGDVDGDGHVEVLVAGKGALLWYRPDTWEQGIAAEGHFQVGLALEDMDGDGMLEAFATVLEGDGPWQLWGFDPPPGLQGLWERYLIDAHCNGGGHDILFCDVDGDGRREMLANATYCAVPGVYIYKPGDDLRVPWHKHVVSEGVFSEGLNAADLTGDGRMEIVHGPDIYVQPPGGPYAGTWSRQVYAWGFREMSRTAVVDITANGCPDLVIAESEYTDGRVCWYENRLAQGEGWVEHVLETDTVVNFAHSLNVRRDGQTVTVFLAEMAAGGWDAPYNWDARLIQYVTCDGGATWNREVISRGAGTHQAVMADVDGDGEVEIAGKEWGSARHIPKVQIWKNMPPSPLTAYKHHFLDRDKPHTATDIFAADVTGDGVCEVVCGRWWYHVDAQVRHEIPGIYQAHTAYDIDGDGQMEVIASKQKGGASGWYGGLSSELCWIKFVDGVWEEHPIGTGTGDWAHGSLVAPVLPSGRLALLVGYHSAHADPDRPDYPELFEIPDDPARPWPKRVLADIPYGEELAVCDISGNGILDIVAGAWWLENNADGTFTPHEIIRDFYPARLAVADVNGNGRIDIVLGEEVLDYPHRTTPWSRLAWFEHPADPRQPWAMHVIDTVRCAHSIAVADLDGDGELEVVAGEHDPFKPYRSRCRTLIYKKADPQGRAWRRYVVDDRFEHHDGTKVLTLPDGTLGIISHGWQDSKYVHLWKLDI